MSPALARLLATMPWCPCCLYAPLGSPDNIAFCHCMEELFHVGFPLLVSLAVEGISWFENFLNYSDSSKLPKPSIPFRVSLYWALTVSSRVGTSSGSLRGFQYVYDVFMLSHLLFVHKVVLINPDVLWLACVRLTPELIIWSNAQHGPHDSRQCGASCQREMHDQSLTWGHHSARRQSQQLLSCVF